MKQKMTRSFCIKYLSLFFPRLHSILDGQLSKEFKLPEHLASWVDLLYAVGKIGQSLQKRSKEDDHAVMTKTKTDKILELDIVSKITHSVLFYTLCVK